MTSLKKNLKEKEKKKKTHPALKNIINFAYHFPRPEFSASLEVQTGKTGKTKMKWVSICCLIFRECPMTCGRKAAVSAVRLGTQQLAWVVKQGP